MRKNVKTYLLAVTAAATVMCGLWGTNLEKPQEAVAASNKETVNLRIIGTTDLHGQLNSKDYELGVDYSDGGLARLADLIQKTKREVPSESVITVDAGDTLYDYTTEYIFSESQEEVQPIYKAMAQIGYDAITLGNHDFDYGYEYILKQLNGSGMRNVTVVSNITDSKTGEYPFLENMLITRTLTTSEGKKVDVQIGIIGLTIPDLSPKTHSYVGILKGEDMVANAKAEAQKLKDMGADVIIALAHTGIGPENPEVNFKNVAYALTKIDNIDVVVCGHEHNQFPTTDLTSSYFGLPGVDKKTCLMNGKNVIMAGNRGSFLGVVDLTLTLYSNGNYRISNRSSQLRPVTADTTTEVKEIAGLYGSWEEPLLNYSTDVIAGLGKDEVIQNFYGMLGDNASIQLLNDARIDYAQRFVQTTGEQYKDYPIIAASRYVAYGEASLQDFTNIRDKITESDLSSIQPYNNYVYIYTITGKQIKEWLEWSASAFETTSLTTKWNNATMRDLMKETNLKSLLREDWLNDWSSFTIFDGIDYVMDPSSEPRYDLSGNKISNSSRISSVSYNGNPVTDDMKFLIVSNKITAPTAANKGVEKQVALNGYVRTQAVLSKYIKEIADNETSIMPQLDYNWNVKIPSGTDFIVKVPSYASDFFEQSKWYQEKLTEKDGYNYYKASYPDNTKDDTAPHIVATQVTTSATASPYKVMVNATDISGIKSLVYVEGSYKEDFFEKSSGMKLASDHTFTVTENGIYTVCAEDNNGNKSIYHVNITNFSDNLLSSPTVNSYTNRKTKITGRGEPNAKIVFMAYTGTYESKVSSKGTFSYALPSQPSGSKVVVYLQDEKKGLESARVSVMVKRTGPNVPNVSTITNTIGSITGDLNDDDASIIAMIGDKVYVPENGGKELYQKCTEIFNPALTIVGCKFESNDFGYYRLIIPAQQAGSNATIYSVDHVSRNSRAVTTTIIEEGPNAPAMYEVSNIERSMNGIVPTSVKKVFTVEIMIGDKSYSIQTDNDGKFQLNFNDQLYAGEKITITAYDVKNGLKRKSFTSEYFVHDIEEYIREDSASLVLNRTTDKSYLIAGSYSENTTIYLAVTSGSSIKFSNVIYTTTTDASGRFKYRLDGKLEAGSTVYAMIRFTDGKILVANKTEVLAGIPDAPGLVKEITNTDKTVEVIAKKDSVVALQIGSDQYTQTAYQYDQKKNDYVYTFDIDRAVSNAVVKITASNSSGTSDVYQSSVAKAAPDRPTVDTVKAGAKSITGVVELYDYVTAEEAEGTVVELPKRFKDAAAKVAQTQTRILAQIGTKLYEGAITNQGKFKIEIPEQKAGTEILVWGANQAGRGPLVRITVES